MKKLLSVAILTLSVPVLTWSQTLESIKTFALLGQMDKAKTEIDKAANNPKVMGKPEAHILKTAIYASISMTDENRNKPTGNALVQEADASFEKYKSMDPEMKKMSEEDLYKNGPINIYYNYYNQGLADYNDKKWESAIPKLEKAISYSDLLISKTMLTSPVDTNLLILTGFVAERANNVNAAVMVYRRLAEAKVTGADFEGVYQYLVRYYFTSKDLPNFEKMKTLGASLYPESDFFKLDELDFTVGLAESITDKMKALNEFIANNPESYKAHDLRWTYLYDTLASVEEGVVLPERAAWENDLLVSIKKCIQLKPGDVKNHQYLGNVYVLKKDQANEARVKFAEELQKRTKPGTKASPADIAKREQLDKEYQEAMERIIEPYTEAAKLYAGMSGLSARDKQQYKNVAGYLMEVYEYKQKRAAKDPAQAAKWGAEAKKWNDVYESIK